eukprot:Sspe_Gene.85763::Locus_56514_Transcript_1_1_Confidence_1.000_Length_791::g.85763::m.85763
MSDDASNAVLFRSAKSGCGEEVKLLLDGGADVGARDEVGDTALHIAARHNPRIEVLEVLLEAGAHLNGEGGWLTPLHVAAMDNTVEYLVGRGADVKVADLQHDTALHYAAACNPLTGVLGVLLDAGANVNAMNDKAMVPLHYAATSNTAAIVEYLVQRGADVEAMSSDGCTPLREARISKRWEVVTVLRNWRE